MQEKEEFAFIIFFGGGVCSTRLIFDQGVKVNAQENTIRADALREAAALVKSSANLHSMYAKYPREGAPSAEMWAFSSEFLYDAADRILDRIEVAK